MSLSAHRLSSNSLNVDFKCHGIEQHESIKDRSVHWLGIKDSGNRHRIRLRASSATSNVVLEKGYGAGATQGLTRPSMEDTFTLYVDEKGLEPSFFAVFDGHGGNAVAEMLKASFWPIYKKWLSGADSDLVKATRSAYLEVDQLALAQPGGFLGAFRERGLGGSRCGATAATAVILPSREGRQVLIAANVGDARLILCRDGQASQLTVDHKPDVESERRRIEAKNPTPKKPLVVNVEGTWRVGGLLSLSRAFGDVYLKDWSDGKPDGARGGFGLTAEPDVKVETLSPDCQFLLLATDGLWEHLGNQEAVDLCLSARNTSKTIEETIKILIDTAQERGATDDISVIVAYL